MESVLFKKLEDAVKEAMKAHDAVKRDCIRSVISEINNATVNAGKELTDAICMKMLQKSVKTHADSIEQFSSAGRDDLVAKKKAELDVLNSFLPKMLDLNLIMIKQSDKSRLKRHSGKQLAYIFLKKVIVIKEKTRWRKHFRRKKIKKP